MPKHDQALGNLRFEGYGYPELARQLDRLRNGAGTGSLESAVDALKTLAESLDQTDRTLREELAKIGVEWEGEASTRGKEATKQAGVYAEEAAPVVAASAGGVGEQSAIFASTKNTAPMGGELRGPNHTNFVDDLAGTFGFTTDNARAVEQTRAAHDAAAAAMNNYSQGSQSAIGGAQALPVPPGLDLVAQPAPHLGGTSAQSFTGNPGSFTPSGGSGAPGAPGSVGLVGGNQVGVFSGIQGSGSGGTAGGVGGTSGNTPGSPGSVNSPTGGGAPLGNGRVAGIGPTVGGLGGLAPGGGGPLSGLRPGFGGSMVDGVATAAGIAGAGGAGAVAGSAMEKDRLVRGGGKGALPGGGGAAGTEGAEGRANNKAAIAGAPEDEARAARNAERLGGTRGGRGSSLMSPAAAGAGAPGEDDDEHVRKYGIDSEDVFGDERLVVSPVLGQDD